MRLLGGVEASGCWGGEVGSGDWGCRGFSLVVGCYGGGVSVGQFCYVFEVDLLRNLQSSSTEKGFCRKFLEDVRLSL